MGISQQKNLNPDTIPTIFERPEPTNTSSVAYDSEDTTSFSWKRTSATASNTTFVTASQPKQPRKAYEKREQARVREIIIIRKQRIINYLL